MWSTRARVCADKRELTWADAAAAAAEAAAAAAAALAAAVAKGENHGLSEAFISSFLKAIHQESIRHQEKIVNA